MPYANNTQATAVFLTQETHTVPAEVISMIRYVIAILAVLVNAAIAVAFLVQKCRRSNVHLSPAGVLVLNLLFADAFVGAVIFRLSTHMTVPSGLCLVTLGIGYLATIGSNIAVLNVVLDRFFAVAYTLKYRDFMTLTRSVVMVCCGWSVPIAGLIGAVALSDWNIKPVARCAEIGAFRTFLEYVGVPSSLIANLCVVVFQCRLYIRLRRHDAESAKNLQKSSKFSHKAACILYRFITPTYIAMLCYDVVLIMLALWFNQVLKSLHDVFLLFVQISYLMNPLVYAYATANIRKPVSDLCADVVKWLVPAKGTTSTSASARPTSQQSVLSVITPK